jgi:hypothetical protein
LTDPRICPPRYKKKAHARDIHLGRASGTLDHPAGAEEAEPKVKLLLSWQWNRGY